MCDDCGRPLDPADRELGPDRRGVGDDPAVGLGPVLRRGVGRSLKIAGGRASDVQEGSTRLTNVSSFGEDAAGELYAVTLNGELFRLISG